MITVKYQDARSGFTITTIKKNYYQNCYDFVESMIALKLC